MLHCFNIQKEQSCFEEYDHMKLYENKVIFFYLIELKNQLCIQVPLQITLIKTWKLHMPLFIHFKIFVPFTGRPKSFSICHKG